MKFRVFDKQRKIFVRGALCSEYVDELPITMNMQGRLQIQFGHKVFMLDPKRFEINWNTEKLDKNENYIYEGDIVKVQNMNGFSEFAVRFGTCQRIMDSGASVDIQGFYFELQDKGGPNDKKPCFSINYNWQGEHDLKITEVIGNIYERTKS